MHMIIIQRLYFMLKVILIFTICSGVGIVCINSIFLHCNATLGEKVHVQVQFLPLCSAQTRKRYGRSCKERIAAKNHKVQLLALIVS